MGPLRGEPGGVDLEAPDHLAEDAQGSPIQILSSKKTNFQAALDMAAKRSSRSSRKFNPVSARSWALWPHLCKLND